VNLEVVKGDILTEKADVVVSTTNGSLNNDGGLA